MALDLTKDPVVQGEKNALNVENNQNSSNNSLLSQGVKKITAGFKNLAPEDLGEEISAIKDNFRALKNKFTGVSAPTVKDANTPIPVDSLTKAPMTKRLLRLSSLFGQTVRESFHEKMQSERVVQVRQTISNNVNPPVADSVAGLVAIGKTITTTLADTRERWHAPELQQRRQEIKIAITDALKSSYSDSTQGLRQGTTLISAVIKKRSPRYLRPVKNALTTVKNSQLYASAHEKLTAGTAKAFSSAQRWNEAHHVSEQALVWWKAIKAKRLRKPVTTFSEALSEVSATVPTAAPAAATPLVKFSENTDSAPLVSAPVNAEDTNLRSSGELTPGACAEPILAHEPDTEAGPKPTHSAHIKKNASLVERFVDRFLLGEGDDESLNTADISFEESEESTATPLNYKEQLRNLKSAGAQKFKQATTALQHTTAVLKDQSKEFCSKAANGAVTFTENARHKTSDKASESFEKLKSFGSDLGSRIALSSKKLKTAAQEKVSSLRSARKNTDDPSSLLTPQVTVEPVVTAQPIQPAPVIPQYPVRAEDPGDDDDYFAIETISLEALCVQVEEEPLSPEEQRPLTPSGTSRSDKTEPSAEQ